MMDWEHLTPEQQQRLARFMDYLNSPQFIVEAYDPDDATPEETDEYLRAHGYDPEQLGKDIREWVEQIPLND